LLLIVREGEGQPAIDGKVPGPRVTRRPSWPAGHQLVLTVQMPRLSVERVSLFPGKKTVDLHDLHANPDILHIH
jgi:hypothetical protein